MTLQLNDAADCTRLWTLDELDIEIGNPHQCSDRVKATLANRPKYRIQMFTFHPIPRFPQALKFKFEFRPGFLCGKESFTFFDIIDRLPYPLNTGRHASPGSILPKRAVRRNSLVKSCGAILLDNQGR